MDFFQKTEHYGEENQRKDESCGPGQEFASKVDYSEEDADEDADQILEAADEFMDYDEDED